MKTFLKAVNQHFYIFVFFACLAFYYALIFIANTQTDIQLHTNRVLEIILGLDFPPNFLYFIVVYVVGLFQNNYQTLLFASIVVVSFSVAYKFFLTARLFSRETGIDKIFSENQSYLVSNIAAISLITAFCIFLPKELGLTGYFYLGQIPPNVWHNSTVIFLMPFSLLLYWQSYKLLIEFEVKRFLLVVGLILLNILIKPSFFFCFVPVFPLMALFRFKLKKEFFLSMLPVIAGVALLFLQYVMIYWLGSYGKPGESKIALEPFAVWRTYSEYISVSFLLSTAFPLIYLLFYFKRVVSQTFVYYAYLLFVTAMTIMILFIEKGPREADGNFFWQAIVCNYILFFAVAMDFAKQLLQERKLNARDYVIGTVFILHILSGWIYLAKFLLRANYG
jgi:hypothetical protein